jgi:hypothetical protein
MIEIEQFASWKTGMKLIGSVAKPLFNSKMILARSDVTRYLLKTIVLYVSSATERGYFVASGNMAYGSHFLREYKTATMCLEALKVTLHYFECPDYFESYSRERSIVGFLLRVPF